MNKRVAGLLLAGILMVSMSTGELLGIRALAQETDKNIEDCSEETLSAWEEAEEVWTPPVGGMKEGEIIELTREQAQAAGILENGAKGRTAEQKGEAFFSYGSQNYSSSWDKYSSNYIYNRLNKKEKEFWDGLDKLCRNYLLGNKDAVEFVLVKDKDGNPYWVKGMVPGVSYASLGISIERVGELRILFTYANPQYYFLDIYNYYYNGVLYPVIYDEFAKGSERKKITAKIKKSIDKMEKQIAKGKTDLEKEKIAHDLIIKNVKYDHYFDTPKAHTLYHQSAAGIFLDQYTVCAGYTKAFELLMNGAGVDTIAVGGKGHAWNMVCINDQWYHTDVTWGDRDGAGGVEAAYEYFNRSESKMEELDNKYHKVEALYKPYIPKSTQDSGASETDIGNYKQPASTVKKPVISQKKVSGGLQITIRTASPKADIYYTLDGKQPSPSYTRSCLYTKPFKVSSNVTVRAIAVCDGKWNSAVSASKVYGRIYKVTFNTMGGSKISVRNVYDHSTVKQPVNPKRAGYKFAGWYRDKKYQKPWDFKKKVSKNMTLYAKWKKK